MLGSRAGRRLRGWPHWRHFLSNLVIGLLIEVVIHFMTGGLFVTHLRNAVQDAAMNVAAHLPGAERRSGPAITVFDVDEETWRDRAWGGGEVDLAPRAQMARLVDVAVRGGARYVVVDIVVEGAGSPQDAEFVQSMGEIARRLRPDQHLLFVRSVRAPICTDSDVGSCAETVSAPTLRASPMDALFAQTGTRLIKVAPNFLVAPDGVLRRWVLWKPACVPDASAEGTVGTWQVLPSVQLAIRDLERQRTQGAKPAWSAAPGFGPCLPTTAGEQTPVPPTDPVIALADAEAAMTRALAPTGEPAEAGHASHEPTHGGGQNDPASVIFFRYAAGTGSVAVGGNGIQTLNARTLLDGRDPGSLAGQVVIVAQSHEFARDHHLTPLGRLPGAMVLVNSIRSMQDPGIIEHAPGALEYLFAVVSIILAAWLFAVVRAEYSLLLAIGFVPVLLCVSYLSLGAGMQLGSEIALLGIYLHWLFKTIETALEAGRGHDHGDPHRVSHGTASDVEERRE